MSIDKHDVALGAGIILIVAGVFLYSPPLGLAVLGLAIVLLAVLSAHARPPKRGPS